MSDESIHEKLRLMVEQGQFLRAAYTALSQEPSEEKEAELNEKALWEMAALCRNVHGTKKIARDFDISKQEAARTLKKIAGEEMDRGNKKPLEPCYDLQTGEYLSFDQWLDNLLKKWDRIPEF